MTTFHPTRRALLLLTMTSLFGGLLVACGGASAPKGESPVAKTRTLTLAAYTTPREAYGKSVLPAFTRYWKEKTGEDVKFEESYLGSGAQSRAVVEGFEADVVAISLEADVERIVKAGLIQHDWKNNPTKGMVSRSIVVLGVRQGNPKGIKDWDDLRQKNLEILTPNVKTSGGAMWNVAAIWGAAMRGHTSSEAGSVGGAEQLLTDVLANVKIMDKGARESMLTFEKGVGDVIITYENEILVGRQAGNSYDYVIPRSTILIENPIAVVDAYASKRGNLEIARAFVDFCTGAEAQRAFSKYGLRPVDEGVAAEVAASYPPVTDLFTVRDLGDWAGVQKALFDSGAAYDRAMESVNKKK
jgi:sulfate transport system substrate-binding protein